jgi:hypothetical protein
LSPHFPRWVFFYCESAPETGMYLSPLLCPNSLPHYEWNGI